MLVFVTAKMAGADFVAPYRGCCGATQPVENPRLGSLSDVSLTLTTSSPTADISSVPFGSRDVDPRGNHVKRADAGDADPTGVTPLTHCMGPPPAVFTTRGDVENKMGNLGYACAYDPFFRGVANRAALREKSSSFSSPLCLAASSASLLSLLYECFRSTNLLVWRFDDSSSLTRFQFGDVGATPSSFDAPVAAAAAAAAAACVAASFRDWSRLSLRPIQKERN